MQINAQTKIAALIKGHADALEAIITLSPDFKKLRNPVLRKLMAGRTSIAMASKIGGCSPEDFFKALSPLGFVSDNSAPVQEFSNQKSLKEFVKDMERAHIIPLDVREMLADGKDPLKLIQQSIKELKDGQVLKIINTFEPSPLIILLEKQGFSAYVDKVDNKHIETYFYRTKSAEIKQDELAKEENNDWDFLLEKYNDKLVNIDVRHLEMPGPMMAILEELEKLKQNMALYVHHKRIPVFLLSELKDRNFEYRIKVVSDTEVFLLIFRP